jgi:hypothetical protein
MEVSSASAMGRRWSTVSGVLFVTSVAVAQTPPRSAMDKVRACMSRGGSQVKVNRCILQALGGSERRRLPEISTTPAPSLAQPVACRDGMVRVGAVCMASGLVRVGAVRRCVRDGGCRGRRSIGGNACDLSQLPTTRPATCLSWEEARTFCRSVYGSNGDLPTPAERFAAREVAPPLEASTLDEWGVSARGGEAMFGSDLDGAARPRWRISFMGTGRESIAFRCVVRGAPLPL